MSFIAKFRERAADSAVDFALNAMWVALWGMVLTGGVAIWAYRTTILNIPFVWVVFLAGAFTAFLLLFVITIALVWLTRRAKRVPQPTGNRGYLNFKVDATRSISRSLRHVTRIGHEIEQIGRIFTESHLDIERIQRRGWQTDERGLRSANFTGRRLLRCANRLDVHVKHFIAHSDAFVLNTSLWVAWLRDAEAGDTLNELRPVFEAIRGQFGGTQTTVQEFIATTQQIRKVSDGLDLAGGRIVDILMSYLDALRRVVTMSHDAAS